ncbi:MAG: ComEA family DNA-binding protein [Candidatus Nanopelagicales bacterium]
MLSSEGAPLREQLRTRYGLEPRAVVVLALLGVLGVVLAVGVVWRGRATEMVPGTTATGSSSPVVHSGAAPAAVGSGASALSTVSGERPTDSAAAATVIVVDVVGAVARPGVVRLPEGARVVDAIRAAGGVLPGTETTGLNLARLVADGEQVAVGIPAGDPDKATPPGQLPGSGAGSVAHPSGDDRLDLNGATAAQLEELPGIGPVLAGRIVEWRTRNGRFASVDELNEVSGIGDATFAELASLVRV